MRFLAVLILLAMCAGALPAWAADAPDFELDSLEGVEYSLEELLEECDLLVIEFWQAGCKPCNELVAHLQGYYDEFREDGVEIVIISRDTALTLAQVEPFFRSQEYTFRVLLDTELDVSTDFGVKASPATFFINSAGEIIWQHFNYRAGQEKEVREKIENFLAGEEIEVEEEAETAEAADEE